MNQRLSLRRLRLPVPDFPRVERGVWILACMMFAMLAVLLAVVPINFVIADLGRHLKNGELFFATGSLLATNFYAYTEPHHPAANPQWLADVIFYLLWKAGDFIGLHLAFLAVQAATIILLLRLACREAHSRVVLLVAVLLAPLLVGRLEIRPEGLSSFAIALSLMLLSRVHPLDQRPLWRVLLPFALLSVVWVNTDEFFFLGWLLTGGFLLQAWIDGGFKARLFFDPRHRQGRLALILLTQILLSAVANPRGLWGVFGAFDLLRDHGYLVVDNQSIPFLLKRLGDGIYWHYALAGVASLGLVIGVVVWRREWRPVAGWAFILAVFYLVGFFISRAMPLFALVALPILALLIQRLTDSETFRALALVFSCGLMGLSLISQNVYFSPRGVPHIFGLMPGVQKTGEFIKAAGIDGPILNNIDIGNYFIFHFFPRHRPFVDNRTQAYSDEFFQHTYQPMLRDEDNWRRVDGQFRFNAIVFYRHDATEFAQLFIIRRLLDKEWAPVMVDAYNIVLVRRNPKNAAIIRQFELPKEMFNAVK